MLIARKLHRETTQNEIATIFQFTDSTYAFV